MLGNTTAMGGFGRFTFAGSSAARVCLIASSHPGSPMLAVVTGRSSPSSGTRTTCANGCPHLIKYLNHLTYKKAPPPPPISQQGATKGPPFPKRAHHQSVQRHIKTFPSERKFDRVFGVVFSGQYYSTGAREGTKEGASANPLLFNRSQVS